MIGLAILCCSTLIGQTKQEVSVYGSGGLSTLKYKTTIGKQSNGTGGQFGLGYTYFFSEKLGFNTGMEIALYNAKMELDNSSDKYMTKDIDGDEFEFRTTVNDYEEKQNATYINIPIILQFQTGKKNKIYAAAGGKIGIPVGGNYKINNARVTNSGYYAEEDYEYTTQEFLGFGTFSRKNMSDDIKYKMAFILSGELGVKWKLKNGLYLYSGAYIDYGLNDVLKEDKGKRLVEYNAITPWSFLMNGALVSQYNHDGKSEDIVDKINLMTIGVKIRLAFDIGNQTSR